MEEVFDRLTDRSLSILRSINPNNTALDLISAGPTLSKLAQLDPDIAVIIDLIGISKKSTVKIIFSDWLVHSYHEASLIESDSVDIQHMFFALLLQLDSELYYLGKREYLNLLNSKTDSALSEYVDDLSKLAKKVKDPLIGRENELTKLMVTLSTEDTKPVLLLGDSGSGKSRIMIELARRINKGDVPEALKDSVVYRVKLSKLISTFPMDQNLPPTDFFSKLFFELVKKETDRKNVILFFDDLRIGTNVFIGFGPNTLDSGVSIVGAAQNDISERFWDSPIPKSWNIIPLNDIEDIYIKEILLNESEKYEDIEFSEESIEKILDIYKNDSIEGAMPGIGIKSIESVVVYKKYLAEVSSREKSRKSRKHYVEVSDIEAYYDGDSITDAITVDHVSDMPLERLANIEQILSEKVIGQDSALKTISRSLKIASLQLGDETKPIGCYLLLGPTGVGKTECAKALAGSMYGYKDMNKKKPNNFLRIDMSEYSESHTVSKLYGAPPGYVGYDDSGSLCDYVRENPSSIVLFDEIDKAHNKVLTSLLHIMDEGIIRDNEGEHVSFESVVILMTSNHGTELLKKHNIGYAKSNESDFIRMEEILLKNIKIELKPEFINRFDDIVIFNNLSTDSIYKIIDINIYPIIQKLKKRNVKLDVTKKARKLIAKESNYLEYGARDVKRVINKEVSSKIADILISKPKTKAIKIKAIKDQFKIEVSK